MKNRILLTSLVVLLALGVGLAGCGGEEIPEYDLTISTTEGGELTTPGALTSSYDEGAEVPLVALPHAGYRFDNWSGDVDAVADINAASTTVTMNGDYSITANFVKQYVLMIDSTDGGEVTIPAEGSSVYDEGAVVDLVAEAEEGYKFLNWAGDVDTVADVSVASTVLTVEGDCVVTANFILEHAYLDMIGPGLWGLYTAGEGVQATVAEEGLVVNMASDSADGHDSEPPQFAGRGRSQYALEGDFDIRMRYELTTWVQGSGVRVGLLVGVPNSLVKIVSVQRVGFGSDEFSGEPREAYLVALDDSILGITGTDHLSGILRIRREGETISCYYGTPEYWQELCQAEWSLEHVYVTIGAWSHEICFGREDVSVLMRTVEIVEPAL